MEITGGIATPQPKDKPKAKVAAKRPPRATSTGLTRAHARPAARAGGWGWRHVTTVLGQLVKLLTLAKWFLEHVRSQGPP
jgi:hypothetical protein